MRQFVAAKALYRTEPVGKHQLFYLLDGVDRHIKRPHPQFVSLWRCQFVANDEPSSLPQHSAYLTESNVDIIPKIDGLESGNNIKHFIVERYCRYICFVYFRPLLCYRMVIYFYRFLYTLGRVIDTVNPALGTFQEMGNIPPTTATDIENIFVALRFYTFIDTPHSHRVMPQVHSPKHHSSPEVTLGLSCVSDYSVKHTVISILFFPIDKSHSVYHPRRT